MKKKLLLISCMVALFVYLFVISVSAATVKEVTINEIIYTLTEDEATGNYTACVGSTNTATNKNHAVYPNTEITIPAYVEFDEKNYKVTDINFTAFEGANITKVVFDPACEIEIIREYTFKNCKSLTTVVLPSNLKIIAGGAFTQCSSLTALYLPETLERIGGLITAGATLGNGNDAKTNAGTFLGCTNLYFVNNLGDTEKPDVWYAPASLKELYGEGIKQLPNVNSVMVFGEKLSFVDDGYFFADKGKQSLTFIFKGDFTQEGSKFEVTCENKNNTFYFVHPNVKDHSFITYDTWRGDTPASNLYFCSAEKVYTLKGTPQNSDAVYTELDSFSHIVERTVTTEPTCTENSFNVECCYCDAAVSRTELENTALGHSHTEFIDLVYADFSKAGYYSYECENCGDVSNETIASALFTCLGYSAPENGTGGMAIGFTVNNVAIAEYEEVTGKTLKYGVFAVLQDRIGDNDVFAEDGTSAEGVINAEIANYDFEAFELKIVGFTDEQKDIKLAMGAYVAVTDGETTEYSYMQGETPAEGDNYHYVSYNDVLGKSEESAQ